MSDDGRNRAAHNYAASTKADVVKRFELAQKLHPCEQYTFDKYIKKGQDILDIGVGGGRTVSYLSSKAKTYIGVDFSPRMIDACLRRYPTLDFRVEDATELKSFLDASFDVVVFTFNGISAIPTDEGRARCFKEVFRILRPNGIFIFSVGNSEFLAFLPSFYGASVLQKAWRVLLSIAKTASLVFRTLTSGVFYSKRGYLFLPLDGGVYLYAATQGIVDSECASAGFKTSDVVEYNMVKLPRFFVGSYCYVVSK
jgi:ubiquinone/menaquinone biosynthesis C-methylase UbiE